MTDYSDFSLGKKKDNFLVNLDNIKGGLKSAALNEQMYSIFKQVIDSDENDIIDKEEIDKFIEEIKTYAKDNNFSMSEAAKYLKMNQLQNVKPEELFKFIENLSQASENIEESSVVTDNEGKKTVYIKYKDMREETIYPDKTSKLEFNGENNEKITRKLNSQGEPLSETVIYEDKSKKTTTFENNLPKEEILEKDGIITTTQFEEGKPKTKTIKSGETQTVFSYVNGEEKLTYSKKFENKKCIEETYQYNEKGQLVRSEVKKGDNDTTVQTFEYHPNGQISSRTTESCYKSDDSENNQTVTVTFDENGKRLHLTKSSYWKHKEFEHNGNDEIDFDKNGNIVGYVPKDATLEQVLKYLRIEKGTELYDKFMELNKDVIKSYRNGKVISFEVGAKIIIPGELEDSALYYTGIDPKYEKESYARDNIGNADIHGIPTGRYKVEKDTTWWELAKQNLIDLGNTKPTKEQIAKQMDILVTLNNASWNLNDPVKKDTEIEVQIKESSTLLDLYKTATYNIDNLRKKYPSDKYTIKKVVINPEKNEWGENDPPIYAYHIYDKSTNKEVLSVVPEKESFSKAFTVTYFNNSGQKNRVLKLGQYDKKVEETVYRNGTEYKSTYDENGVHLTLEYVDPNTKRIVSIDHPSSPDKTIVIKKSAMDIEEIRYYRNGKLYVKEVNRLRIYYDQNEQEQYTETWEMGYKNLKVNFPAAMEFGVSLRSKDGNKAIQILNNLNKDNYKMFLLAYAQIKKANDPIKDIQKSGLDEVTKSKLIATLRNLINEDNKITTPQRTGTGKNGNRFSSKLNGDVLTITNHTIGKTHTIDFNDKLSDCTEFEKARLKKLITEKLPLEVVEDLAIESRDLNVAVDENVIKNNPDWKAAGQYFSWDDTITLMAPLVYGKGEEKVGYFRSHSADYIDKELIEVLTHEIGHAIDYNGYVMNTHSSASGEFYEAFKKELEGYKAAGKVQYSYDKDFKRESSSNFNEETGKIDFDSNTCYATANEKEMFAECYALLMNGYCQSKEHIEKYFPQTLKAARKLLAEIRQLSDNERCNPVHV